MACAIAVVAEQHVFKFVYGFSVVYYVMPVQGPEPVFNEILAFFCIYYFFYLFIELVDLRISEYYLLSTAAFSAFPAFE